MLNNSLLRCNKNGLIYFTAPSFSSFKSVSHIFTTRHGGISTGHLSSLNLGFSLGDNRENVAENYERVLKILNATPDRLVLAKQVHKDNVLTAGPEHAGAGILKPQNYEADAIITSEKGLAIAGFYADCTVTILYDTENHAVGVVHAGWRGVINRIISKAISEMSVKFSSRPEKIITATGPSICQNCFETDEDVAFEFYKVFGNEMNQYIEQSNKKWYINLSQINAELIKATGVPEQNITLSCECTSCMSDMFWSHRKTQGKRGVQCAIIMLK